LSEKRMQSNNEDILEVPIYSTFDAAHYLRVPYQTLRYWIRGSGSIEPIIKPADTDPPRLSFMNLMECHMLSAMRTHYNLRLPKVRKALRNLATMFPTPHPLVNRDFETDEVDVFIREHGNELINLNRPGQMGFREVLEMHMKRIERTATGIPMFFPFIERRSSDEPRSITISPAISFGRPVISGTGIPTAVIASRFHARESVGDLAREYGRTDKEIEEAIRWESRAIAA
jgi:uncharacterized protein (DUF433 family)